MPSEVRYRLSSFSNPTVEEIEIVNETDRTVDVRTSGPGSGPAMIRREAKETNYTSIHKTVDEAWQRAEERLSKEIEQISKDLLDRQRLMVRVVNIRERNAAGTKN